MHREASFLTQTAPTPTAESEPLPVSTDRARSLAFPLILVIALAAVAFFYRLGATPLNDWDEAWHAEVSREILTTGDWLTLHYRGDVYFNKPPLTFWIRAIAFRAFGIHEWTARLGSAFFGYASVIAVAWFSLRKFTSLACVFAGLILSTSWLFTTYHAGRSGETDGTLVFFNILTLISLWRARLVPRWFYIAGIFTALAWMTKGATAYLPWLAAAGVTVVDRSQPRWHWRHAVGGLALGFLLAAPWQLAMLAAHGRTFFQAFYIHEALDPALGVSEGHGGNWAFHLSMLRLFFQPWLSLAGAGAIAVFLQRDQRPAARWIVAWGIVMLGGCSLIPTKMIWYAAPALPPLAILAGITVAALVQRRGGYLLLAAAAALAIAHFLQPSWSAPSALWGVALTLLAGAALTVARDSRFRVAAILGVIGAAIPVILDGVTLGRVLTRDTNPEEWLDRRESDEPWREFSGRLAKQFPQRSFILAGFTASPAAEFYLRQAVGDARLRESPDIRGVATQPGDVMVVRLEAVEPLRLMGWDLLVADESLAALEKSSPAAAAPPSATLLLRVR